MGVTAQYIREPISRGLRFKVFSRDVFTCQYCGRKPPEVVLEPDHVMPVSAGGKSNLENLTTSCRDCNRAKHANRIGPDGEIKHWTGPRAKKLQPHKPPPPLRNGKLRRASGDAPLRDRLSIKDQVAMLESEFPDPSVVFRADKKIAGTTREWAQSFKLFNVDLTEWALSVQFDWLARRMFYMKNSHRISRDLTNLLEVDIWYPTI